jgi:hypothetical protein
VISDQKFPHRLVSTNWAWQHGDRDLWNGAKIAISEGHMLELGWLWPGNGQTNCLEQSCIHSAEFVYKYRLRWHVKCPHKVWSLGFVL